MAGESEHLARLIDAFFSAEKTLAGRGMWQQTEDANEQRVAWPLLLNGEGSDNQLAVSYYANERPPEFSIGVYAPRAIARLDFKPRGGHRNPFLRPAGLELIIRGAHVHTWQDNRHLCTASALPQRLRIARAIPPQVQTFENAFRWFCGEVRIKVGANDMPDAPRAGRLI